ncbi:MAG TPA: hypothetical protein VLL28_06615 [Hyphomicrobiaceae bacterium]|nr:hypothetical protein [Hyphomicrobiaceae bacterium]
MTYNLSHFSDWQLIRKGEGAGREFWRVNDTLPAFVARWSASKCHTAALNLLSFIRPVTPEAAGSNPVTRKQLAAHSTIMSLI